MKQKAVCFEVLDLITGTSSSVYKILPYDHKLIRQYLNTQNKLDSNKVYMNYRVINPQSLLKCN